jgi:cell division protein FtsX
VGINFFNTLKVLFFGMLVGLIGAVIGGAFIATPIQIASKLHVATYVSGVLLGSYSGNNLKVRTYYAFIGGIGSIIGWLLYRGIIL